MAGSLPHYKTGPMNKQVSTLVFGGQIVVPTTAGSSTDLTVKPADGNRVDCFGIAGNDANVITTQTGAANTYGQPAIDISVLTDYVSVYFGGVDIWAWYSAATNEGALVMSAASGTLVPWVRQGATYLQASGDAGLIVGRCTHSGGVTAGMLNQAIGGIGGATFRLARVRIF